MEMDTRGFASSPFVAVPSAQRYLPVGSIETGRQRLLEGIVQGAGPGLIIGGPGMGKTMLCAVLAAELQKTHDVVMLGEWRLRFCRSLLHNLLHQLEIPYRGRSEEELRLSLIERATQGSPAQGSPAQGSPAQGSTSQGSTSQGGPAQGKRSSSGGIVIIADEAQSLPRRLLEELRLLSGVVRGGMGRIQLLLCGLPLLDERLAHPRMEALQQRIAVRCYLHPLTLAETGDYVRRGFARIDQGENMIDEDAIRSIFFASDGNPRLINQTVQYAIQIAVRERLSRLSASLIDRAWRELQQLPGPQTAVVNSQVGGAFTAASLRSKNEPWGEREMNHLGSGAASIEFGPLDDFDEPGRDPMADTVDYEPPREEKVDEHVETDCAPSTAESQAGRFPLRDIPVRRGQSLRDELFGNYYRDEEPIADPAALANDPPLLEIIDSGSSRGAKAGTGPWSGEWKLHEEIASLKRETAGAMSNSTAPRSGVPQSSVPQSSVPFDSSAPMAGDQMRFDGGRPWDAARGQDDRESLDFDPSSASASERFIGPEIAGSVVRLGGIQDISDISVHDDSDLLIVEEDVPLESPLGISPVIPRPAEDRSIADQQTMLQRMREIAEPWENHGNTF